MVSPWLEAATSTSGRTEVTVHRQPVMRLDRTVHGYAVRVVVRSPFAVDGLRAELDALVHAHYEYLDLAALASSDVVFLRATASMLISDWSFTVPLGGVVLEVPRHFAGLPDAVSHLRRLRASGVGLALADYGPGGGNDTLLPLVDFAKVDLGRGGQCAADAVEHAHAGGLTVIAERVDSRAAVRFCADHGVEMFQGPLFQRDATVSAREFTVGEIQCLELMALFSADEVDSDRVIEVISSDPELVMRVLGLVNSSAFGMRRRIDSVRQSVTLLGPQSLGALAAASLIDASCSSAAELWFVLTRAVACQSLVGDDVAYTVGLLSAVASQLRVSPVDLIARTGVSDDVGAALLTRSGPYGPVLAAVLAHEENDIAGVQATGLDPLAVARAYLAAVADALRTATVLSGPEG